MKRSYLGDEKHMSNKRRPVIARMRAANELKVWFQAAGRSKTESFKAIQAAAHKTYITKI